jgi:NAD(P)-dependent dehydrogenase (short-subunit alcohol dehydrogenase family)
MRGYLSILASAFPGEPKWHAEDMPDLTGKVMLVTGGNTGVGKETVKVRLCIACRRHQPNERTLQALLAKNAKVYLAARSRAKAQAAIDELRVVTGREAIFLELDLSNLKSVRAAAATFLRYVCVRDRPRVWRLTGWPAWRPNCTCSSPTRTRPCAYVRVPRCSHGYLRSGVMTTPMDQLTADGYDLQWGTNVMVRL